MLIFSLLLDSDDDYEKPGMYLIKLPSTSTIPSEQESLEFLGISLCSSLLQKYLSLSINLKTYKCKTKYI